MAAKRLVTGIRPTGDIHLGNYFAAIKPTIDLQNEYDCYIFVADLHALNQRSDADGLNRSILEITKAYLAAGLNPERVHLFQQSALPHPELAWMIGAQVGIGVLERAHAFKDSVANGSDVNFGLFSYPVLMAADILMYQADVVPVGKDQQQHVEFARDWAERFNNLYGQTFTLPKAIHPEGIETVPGLDGRKMSKRYANVVGLFDTAEVLEKKIMKITTDSKLPEEPKDGGDTIAQLFSLVATPEAAADFLAQYTAGGMGYRQAKEELLAAVLTFLKPIQERKAALDQDEQQVRDVLKRGAEAAREVATETIAKARQHLGLVV
jgi:tryptophanyl-tRNA synthetase